MLLFTFLFDILFSPFNTPRRSLDAFVIVIIVDLLEWGDFGIQVATRPSQPIWSRLGFRQRQLVLQRNAGSRFRGGVPTRRTD